MTLVRTPSRTCTPERWERANRLLIRKALAEFAHERLLTPGARADGERRPLRRPQRRRPDPIPLRRHGRSPSTTGRSTPTRITRHRDGGRTPARRPGLLHRAARRPRPERRDPAGLPGGDLLHPRRHRATSSPSRRSSAAELADADFQAIETGHDRGPPLLRRQQRPARLRRRTSTSRTPPRPASPVRLVWLAAHRDHADVHRRRRPRATTTLLCGELGEDDPATASRPTLPRPGPRPGRLPPHPRPPVAVVEQARRSPSPPRSPSSTWSASGEGDDEYLAQQSIRTFFNATDPEKHYVKTALSVLNMGFMRGPFGRVHGGDPGHQRLARRTDRRATRCCASRACRSSASAPPSATATGSTRPPPTKDSPYRKMLAALWRESPVPAPGSRRAAGHHGLAAARRPRRARPSRPR